MIKKGLSLAQLGFGDFPKPMHSLEPVEEFALKSIKLPFILSGGAQVRRIIVQILLKFFQIETHKIKINFE